MTSDRQLPLHLPLHEALGITRPAVFATVGGGGKTTVLFALAAEWEAAGGESLTVLTTTTKMTIPREGRTLPLAIGQDAAARAGALDNIRRRGLSSAVVGSGRGDRERVLGVDPAWPRQAVDAGLASLVGVEADGSKGRPFKAPALHEPVLPEGVDIVAAVIGAGVLGRPLDERSVHRPEIVAQVAGAEIGDEITPELAARVLMSPDGGRKGCWSRRSLSCWCRGRGGTWRGRGRWRRLVVVGWCCGTWGRGFWSDTCIRGVPHNSQRLVRQKSAPSQHLLASWI